ncbi:hypothetical protein KY325_03140 [Candidatus Woesearchaeota archaeon]|nr:hypothetical protein [Candidatus Woesearchaeota archaeon]MBW3018127.1 hypothetical protein [Candidatus Woesearchaeota archaeon]
MAKKEAHRNEDSRDIVTDSFPALSQYSNKDLQKAAEVINSIANVITSVQKIKEKPAELSVPIDIFAHKISPAEAVVKYLKENLNKTLHDISLLLNRDERGIWSSYRRATKKLSSKFSSFPSGLHIPVSLFSDRTCSILEHVVLYLKDEKQLKGSQIARLLNKKSSTVWTVYNRAVLKMKKKGGKS